MEDASDIDLYFSTMEVFDGSHYDRESFPRLGGKFFVPLIDDSSRGSRRL